jgi:hypothetical protein
MATFLALYRAPVEVLDEWMKLDEATRKEQEAKMKTDWDAWTVAHKDALKGGTEGVGKTKRVSTAGIEDTRNDLMMHSLVEAESHEAAAKVFEGHPHLQIPQATIDVMPLTKLPGMEGM